ncbi:unnamed protein product, partial [Ectocarpus sp. 12 AP-2014]
MPPKGKDKGKKGAKGAGAVPNVIDEPPQPAPGTPHCLCLVLEVSLFVDPSGRTADSRGSDSGDDVAQGNEPVLVEPVFRYTFINGERITTPPIGLPDSSWTRLNPAENMSENAQEADQSTTAAKEPGWAADADRQPDANVRPLEPIVWRYTRTHQLQGATEDEVALTLDQKPTMLVTLADKSLRGATAQPPGQGVVEGGDNDGNKIGEAAQILPGRNFIESWPLDLSAFLAGETSVSVNVGGGDQTHEAKDSTREKSLSRERLPSSSGGIAWHPEETPDNSKVLDAPPAPEGIRHIKLSVSLPGFGPANPVVGGDPNQSPEGGQIAHPGSAAGDITTTAEGKSIERLERKLFSAEAMERLNPFSIQISSAVSLPGVKIEAESLQDHVKPTRFKLLELHCKPVYIVCRPFLKGPLGESLHPRILWTAGSAQRDKAHFGHTTSFLVGQMDRHRLEDWMENSLLSVEVHDRDPRPSTKEQEEKVLRLERMVSGGYPEEDDACDSSPGDVSQIKANTDSGEADTCAGQEPTPVKCAGPRDIYEVDELVLREAIAEAGSAGKHNAHGVASFRLSGLLDQSRQLVMAYSKSKRKLADDTSIATSAIPSAITDVAPRLKMRTEICQRKRREIPKGGVEDWHLSDEERFVRWPGAYLDAGSSVGVRQANPTRPLRTLEEGSAERTGPATEEPRQFSRAVFVVEYEEGGALTRDVTAAMDLINGRALNNIQGSLRAYVLSPEEKQAADDGALDIVCGFMIIDEDSRTMVLEGLSGPQGGLAALLKKVGRTGPNGQAYRALENPEVRFSRRMYTCFDADLKKVRLRDPLPTLCQNPEIYDRSKVSADCFDALHYLRMLRKVDRLREAAEQGLFPEGAQLIQVESKYGESVSVKDITGRNPVKKGRGNPAAGDGPAVDTTPTASTNAENAATLPGVAGGDGEGNLSTGKQAPARRKAPTDSTNLAFEEWLRGRRPRDFLAEQDEILAKNHNSFVERQRRKDEERRGETVRTEWCYGPQKLNYVELKKASESAEMRERLAKEKGATYTYSMDYVSQTVSLVDEFRVTEDEEAASRAAWKTNRGFVWPCPRTRQELITHPSKPSESRIDTLREPWIENELNGGMQGQMAEATDAGGPLELAWRREFDTVPSNGKAVFGGLQPSKYERPLDTNVIGSRSRLPRGRRQLDKNPEFFRSVHLVGEGLAREKEEEKRRTEELWRSKVVVDDTDFRVGNFNVRDTPLQTDRAKDILHP